MAVDTHAVLRSLRRWLRVVALLLGLGLVALADVGYVLADYGDGLVFAVVGVTGGSVAVVAALSLLSDVLVASGS